MADTPAWRQAYDRLEREVAPRLEELLRSEQFAVAVGLVSRVQRSMEAEAGKSTRRVLHRLNLPAGSDVVRILNEIGQLRRQVHELQIELVDTQRALRATQAELVAAADSPARAPTRSMTAARSSRPAKRAAAKQSAGTAKRAAGAAKKSAGATKKGAADGNGRRV